MSVTSYEVSLRAGARTGRCLAMSVASKGMMGTSWNGNVIIWLAPAGLEAVGELVTGRMIESFVLTQRSNDVARRDAAIITGNSSAALANQRMQFVGLQSAHQIQESIGDGIVQSWDHTQHVYDRIFQQGSDAMRGDQRLWDENLGKEYVVPAGSPYYWMDNASGIVIGTETDTPPDNIRDFRMLKKL